MGTRSPDSGRIAAPEAFATVMPRTFALSWDYRCPFARNAAEHVLSAQAGGADWDVAWLPFSLGQVHVAEGEPPIWDRPDDDSGLWALRAGTVVRDRFPDAFPAVHRALFAVRHDHGLALRDPDVVTAALGEHLGAHDVQTVVEAVKSGDALATVKAEHEAAAAGPGVWGVPTFVIGEDRAVFVRFMDRNPGETAEQQAHGRATIERTLDLLEWTELNEFKATRIPR
jgi:2-hydroxychromene-2-carboxylate isomerase